MSLMLEKDKRPRGPVAVVGSIDRFFARELAGGNFGSPDRNHGMIVFVN